jgi:hypothetical protein
MTILAQRAGCALPDEVITNLGKRKLHVLSRSCN